MQQYKLNIQNKVTIVTGAASGLGKALCAQLASFNANILLVDIDPSVQQVSEDLNKQHNNPKLTSWIISDVGQLDQIQKYFDYAIQVFGHYDIVVNNAGIANQKSLFSQPDSKELDRILNINLRAPMEATRIAARYFKSTNRQGVVLNTASVGGLLPVSLMESYGTTKSALIFFTTTCKRLAPLVRVNAVAPYFADTPMVAENRLVKSFPIVRQLGLMKPEKVVRAMVKAIGDESLCGDTLIVALGAKTERLTIYDRVNVEIASYIAGGATRSIVAFIGSYFTQIINSALGYLRQRKPLPSPSTSTGSQVKKAL